MNENSSKYHGEHIKFHRFDSERRVYIFSDKATAKKFETTIRHHFDVDLFPFIQKK